jgi:hypothetical protein
MAQDNRNKDQQRPNQGGTQDNRQDDRTRQGRSLDQGDSQSNEGGSAGAEQDMDELGDDADEMDEDRDDDTRPEGGQNRRKSIS